MKTASHLLLVLFVQVATGDSTCLQARFSGSEADDWFTDSHGTSYLPSNVLDRDVDTFYHSSTENDGPKRLKLHLTSNNIHINKVTIINRYYYYYLLFRNRMNRVATSCPIRAHLGLIGESYHHQKTDLLANMNPVMQAHRFRSHNQPSDWYYSNPHWSQRS